MRMIFRSLGLVMALSIASFSEEYMLIWQSGEKPNRCAFYADIKSASGQADVRPLTVLEIYENPDGPFASEFVCEFRASDKQCRLVKGTDFFRDDDRKREYAHPSWQDLPNNWQRRAFEFATWDQPWRMAFESDKRNAKLTGRGEQSALASQNCLYAGQHWWPSSLDRFTYKYFWTDTQRPAFTSSKPKEVLERERAELLAYLEWASRTLGGFVETGKAQVKQMDRQRELEELKAQCAQRRPYTRLNGTLQSWVGVSEQALVAQEGPPSSFKIDKGVRCLTYSSSRSQDLMQVQGNGSIQKIGQYDYNIDVTYFVLDGMIFDFAVCGNDPSL
jgi:hypothetical protein